MRRLVITATARRDAAAVLRESRTRFGPQARACYALLLKTAYRDLQTDPERMQAKRPVEALNIWTYAIRHSREHVPAADRVSSPSHMIAYAYDAATVRILRVLHERMDVERRLKDG